MKPKKNPYAWAEDGDSAHWEPSKSSRKRPARKASSAAETKKRFKQNTIKVKTHGKKKAIKVKQ